MSGASPTRSLVVSIHDVSPLTREATDRILVDLRAIGIARLSLLVIPNHHHKAEIAGDQDFAFWLNDRVARGCEAALHGYFHQREQKQGESARTRFMTRLYTAGEGEFFDIGYENARTILARGREELTEAAGVAPSGFVAPAWLLSSDAERALRDLGFTYTTRLKGYWDLAHNCVHPTQSLCWSVRSRWRRAMSLRWNAHLFGRLEANPLMRISIHPPDIEHRQIWRQIVELCARAVETRRPIAYIDFPAQAG